MLRLRVIAPFAAFRGFSAGYYRPTAPFLTPSAAYGLILNVAGIESRFDDGASVATLTRADLPPVDIALGAVRMPQAQLLFQQLHNYPVGSDAAKKGRAAEGKGNKFNIQPVRREYLSDIDAYVCVRGDDALLERIREALRGGGRTRFDGQPRYGLPFLGDNNFLVDVIREEVEPRDPAFWYVRVRAGDESQRQGRCRLTIRIDRMSLGRTESSLFAPTQRQLVDPPSDAWTSIDPTQLLGMRHQA